MLASKKNGVIYIGVTNNIVRRSREHQDGANKGFTRKYYVKRLVYYERRSSIVDAIAREKQIKKWARQRKIRTIEENNPHRKDLADEFMN
ncbi:MAG: GIY-YIG nuclease family protein [candidate division SR1 bacterium]|nr:GIY-YIG nuclease family protein [candidate division SR1 bacterium]